MVSLDLVQASNAQLRELGPGLVALFGALPNPLHPVFIRWYADSMQSVGLVVLVNLLSKRLSETQSLRGFILLEEAPQLPNA